MELAQAVPRAVQLVARAWLAVEAMVCRALPLRASPTAACWAAELVARVWAMVFLGAVIAGLTTLLGRKLGAVFRV